MSARLLTPAEARLLTHLLSNLGGRAASLLPHLEGATVTEGEDPARDLQLNVRADVVPVELPDAPIPGRAHVVDRGGEIRGEIFIFTFNGRLDSVRHASYADEPPTSMPEIGDFQIVPAPRWA